LALAHQEQPLLRLKVPVDLAGLGELTAVQPEDLAAQRELLRAVAVAVAAQILEAAQPEEGAVVPPALFGLFGALPGFAVLHLSPLQT
jgi:hypothetical protein